MFIAAIAHDPDLKLFKKFETLVHNYPQVFNVDFHLVVSRVTPTAAYRSAAPTINIAVQEGRGIADARRHALKLFMEDSYNNHVMVVDFDRLMFWLTHDYQSFKELVEGVYSPFIIVGRTDEAMKSHPEPQRSTERAASAYAFFRLFNMIQAYDILAGTYVMNINLATEILNHSFAIAPGAVDVEWFAIAYTHLNVDSIIHVRVDGLGYEGKWLGLESDINDDIARKRYDNLDNAKAMTDIIYTWTWGKTL